jgi:hypothetical protein
MEEMKRFAEAFLLHLVIHVPFRFRLKAGM